MQKVKLIDVKEKEVQEGVTCIRLRAPMKHRTEMFLPTSSFQLKSLMEEHYEVPIQWFHHTDRIGVNDRRVEGINLEGLMNDGYHISQEQMCYEKTTKYLVAITPEAEKFIEMNREVIEELKCRVENLTTDLLKANMRADIANRNIKLRIEREANKWSKRLKRRILSFCEWLSHVAGI